MILARERLEIQGLFAGQDVLYPFAFALQSAGQDEQSLHLDYADRLLLDVVQFLRGMEDAEGMRLVGAVVPEDEVDAVEPVVVDAGDGGDGVVRGAGAVLALGVGEDVRLRVRVVRPGGAELFGGGEQLRAVLALQPDHRVVPVGDADIDIRKPLHEEMFARARPEDGQHLFAALIVVVREDGAADYGEGGVGADEVAGEQVDEVEHTPESRRSDIHGAVLLGDGDDMLLEVDEGGELHEPILAVQLEGDGPERLAGGMPGVARESDILGAEQALGIAGLGFLGAADFLGRLFGFGEVDRDHDVAAGVLVGPADVAVDVGTADVAAALGELSQPLGGFHGTFVGGDAVEFLDDDGGGRGQKPHYPRLEEQAIGLGAELFADGVVHERSERLVEVFARLGTDVRGLGKPQKVEQRIGGVNGVRAVEFEILLGVSHEFCDIVSCDLFVGSAG